MVNQTDNPFPRQTACRTQIQIKTPLRRAARPTLPLRRRTLPCNLTKAYRSADRVFGSPPHMAWRTRCQLIAPWVGQILYVRVSRDLQFFVPICGEIARCLDPVASGISQLELVAVIVQ